MPAVETYSSTGNAYIDAILGNIKWVPSNLTYSFPTTATSYGSSYGDGEAAKGFGAFNGGQQFITRSALNLYSAVSNLTFQEMDSVSGPSADLRFAQSDLPSTAWAYFPTTDATGGDVWVNHSSRIYASPAKGNYAYLTIVHEIGHALGLEHAHEGDMPLDRDGMEYTVMSYRSYAGASTDMGYTNETWGYAQSLMMYDIAAVQHIYGANYATNAGDTLYSWSPSTGEMVVNGVSQGAPGGNQILLTVWDGGGSDTYSFANYTTELSIDLQPGAWTTTSQEQRAKLHWDGSKLAAGNIANALLYQGNTLSLIENASGGSASDVVKGNIAGNALRGNGGNDKLYGLSDNDVLIGGSGKDLLNGGTGTDIASYVTAKAAVIADLQSSSSNRGDASGDSYASIEGLVGSAYGDTLRGNGASNTIKGEGGKDTLYGRSGNDVIEGGSGSDKLCGQSGKDTLTGGSGADAFIFQAVSDSRRSVIDTITDFRRGSDHIDLRSIDAKTSATGNQAFTFIGKNAFHGKSGELRFADGIVSGDVNGDKSADFKINVAALSALSKSDFYL
ncbi:M10 family metallopeptidase C-terminal domain-containing protein [Microvirga sp. VF16]|uniref:M10 family metallopeptidase C-terminal domain-containing protein n=1 Tax=Microvirga sp. VF16 TaxID=2807101 RepID=UPI00193D1188|nr:M10 family metallopeptidase C-terminal domain-containing protein [Microvirga sp. VF16]QRM28718.1 M10 family metallopeptidase C-terminal domain-containing protein [Microvirga sp. VF16]